MTVSPSGLANRKIDQLDQEVMNMIDGSFGSASIATDSRPEQAAPGMLRVRAIEALRDAHTAYLAGNTDRAQHLRQRAVLCAGRNVVPELLVQLCREYGSEMLASAEIRNKSARCKAMSAHFDAMTYFAPDRADIVMAEVFAAQAYGRPVIEASRLYKLACRFASPRVVSRAFVNAGCVLMGHKSQRMPGCEGYPPHTVVVPNTHPRPKAKGAQSVTA